MFLLRIFLFLLELPLLGRPWAILRFLSRTPEPIDSKKVWQLMNPQNKLLNWFDTNYPPKFLIRCHSFFLHHTVMFKKHLYGIKQHYDISNEFYKLFLDKEYMFYSAGDFKYENESLEVAQKNKANYIANLIDPKPGQKILDLGCGWGAMLKKIYDITKDKENLIGYNLSKEQIRYIREKFGFQVEMRDFITTEYPENSFDTIYSIGAIEHVRNKDLFAFAQKMARTTKPKGKIVHQFFCKLDELPCSTLLFTSEIFPGSQLASIKYHLKTFNKANLRITHHSIHDYRPTLKAWFDRLDKNKEKAIRLVGVWIYNKYLAYFAGAWRLFNDRDLLPMRFVLEPQKKY